MNLSDTYRLSNYHDYGPLDTKENIHLMREKNTGKICVQKKLEASLSDIVTFRISADSPYFPRILAVINDEPDILIIEEYVEGITLEQYMMGSPISEKIAVDFAYQICQALLYLHNATPMIIYRDLKAENIMITPENKIFLVDFHISRQFQNGQKRDTTLLGTAEYAAPEQYGFLQTDNRTDIYAFGVLFNYMMTGKLPADQIAESKYSEIIRKCIQIDPNNRYQNIIDVISELCPDNKTTVSIDSDKFVSNTSSQTSWILPGFRSNRTWKKFISVLGYIFILYIGLTLEFRTTDGILYSSTKMWINRIMFTLSQFATIFFCSNYRGISQEIKPLHSKHLTVRILFWILTWLISVIIAIILTSTLEIIFSL